MQLSGAAHNRTRVYCRHQLVWMIWAKPKTLGCAQMISPKKARLKHNAGAVSAATWQGGGVGLHPVAKVLQAGCGCTPNSSQRSSILNAHGRKS